MNRKWMQGNFTPKNPQKYRGDTKITYRSSWERNLCVWLDTTPEVLAWESEKTVIKYMDPVKGVPRRYFVDFKAIVKKFDGTLGTILIEIKPHKQTMRPREGAKSERTYSTEWNTWRTNEAKWTAARKVCKEKGWEFIILTEKELFNGIDKAYKAPRKKKSPS